MKKLFALLLATVMCLCALSACGSDESIGYTYRVASTSLGTNWNPHTWENSTDNTINGYITSSFVDISILDSENGVYQWVYEMATYITDVTKEHQDDLTKYGATLPDGKSASQVTNGYVFEIGLNPDAKWEDGTPINADTYIYSMQQLLNPQMFNYRANLYISGESALAGGSNYYYSGSPIFEAIVPAYEEEGDYSYDLEAGIANGEVYINVNSADITLYSMSLADLNSSYGLGLDADINDLANAANAYGYTKITDTNREKALGVVKSILNDLFGITDETEVANYTMEALFRDTGEKGEVYSYDTVGCYKVDDYTIRYVTQNSQDINYFLTSCTSTWLVYEPLYEAGKDTSGELVTTNYCSSKETTMAYGPYRIESMQSDRQIVLVQNENWYGWDRDENGELVRDENGNLVSHTNYLVDGQNVRQYMTTSIVIDVMEEAAMKQAFLKGELNDWTPEAEELPNYATSDKLYKVDETYTMSFFFNTNENALKEMDNSKGNTNSIVLSNTNFRKAFSLAMDRSEYVTATAGYKPAYALMNNLYFYDVYNDPNSSYRGSDEAMQAVCNLYGVEYGEGKAYATLKDAYDSISGYNLTEAKNLMKTACDELVAAGLYTKGEDITIRIGWAKGALQSSDNNQVALMNKYINAAVEDSGFGKVTLEAVGNLDDRYSAVSGGEFAIGYGAWGGAAFYPFRNLQVYCDNDQYDINEAACWNPAAEQLTLTVNGEEVTMTWKDWSNALIGNGQFASADNKTKLAITADLEQLYLEKYYRIPICGTTACEVLSYKCSYYTDEYNIMYDFGGLRLMTYNYNDAEWAAFVKDQGGTLSYE